MVLLACTLRPPDTRHLDADLAASFVFSKEIVDLRFGPLSLVGPSGDNVAGATTSVEPSQEGPKYFVL
jgi:hypothetical protein